MNFERLAKLVAENIRTIRKQRNFTQEKLAEASGLNYKFLQRVESGRSNITLKTISKISKALRIHPRKLFN